MGDGDGNGVKCFDGGEDKDDNDIEDDGRREMGDTRSVGIT